MKTTLTSLRFFCLLATAALGCASAPPSPTGGHASGGVSATGGGSSSGGAFAGMIGTGGVATTGGIVATGSGGQSTGGIPTGGSSTGGIQPSGGITTGGMGTGGTGGMGTGGMGMGGMSSSGGITATGGNTGTGGSSPFVLAWQDEFNTLDTSLWTPQTFAGWDGNMCTFAKENVAVANGILNINLTSQPSDSAKPYRGVELRSTKTITYGKVEARIRFAKGPGVVSGLVLIYTPWPADDWNEIDIEHLGKTPTASQFNCMVYTGPPVQKPATASVTPTQFPATVDFSLDVEADFNVYAVEWTPKDVRFYLNGKLLHTWTQEIARMKLPQNILFTIWPSNAASWAGALTSSSVPSSAQMDWIKVYDWKG